MDDLAEEVFCASVASASLPEYCSYCFEQRPSLRKCTACRAVYYCGGKCQKDDWELHKAECSVFKNISDPLKFTDSHRLLLRLSHHWSRGHFGTTSTPLGERSLVDLEEHASDAQLELQALLFLDQFKSIVKKKFIGDAVIKRLFKKSSINSFGMTNQYGQSFGLALCIKLSGVDHSCRPKTRLTYRSRRVTLLSTDPSSQPSILAAEHAYIDELLPLKTRKEILKEKYKFDCSCDGCLDEERNSQMESWICENCTDGWLPPRDAATCVRCRIQGKEDHIETCKMVSETVAEGSKILGRRDLSHDSKKELVEKLMTMVEGTLTPFNVLRLPCLRFLHKECLDSKLLPDAIQHGEAILLIFERYRNQGDIALRYFKYNLAKSYKSLGRVDRIRSLLDQPVLSSFETAYGPDSDIYRSCQDLLS